MGSQLLTLRDAASEYGVTLYFLRKGAENGLIPIVRTSERGQIYIVREGLEQILRQGKTAS